MVSPAMLTVASLLKTTLFVFLLNGPQTLAADTSSNAKCYYPNGFLTKAGRPCTDDGSPSNCCSAGFVCMNTGICKLQGVEYYERQSCTDSDWLDPRCSQMCIEDRMSSNYSVVKACANVNMEKTVYCCNKVSGLDADCCNDPVAGLKRWDFGSKDMHGTAFILKDGSFSKEPETTQTAQTIDGDIITVTAPPGEPTTMVLSEFTVADPVVETATPVTVVLTTTSYDDTTYSTDSTTSASTNGSTTSSSSALSILATAPSAVSTDSTSTSRSSTTDDHRSIIIGVAVGVPLGLVGIALLSFILRRHLKNKASKTATKVVYFPPDPIDPFATRIYPKIELDAVPNAIHELDGMSAPSELEVSVSVVAKQRRPLTVISELEGSPVTPLGPADRISVATAPNEKRWSTVSSLAPPAAHQASRERASIAKTLSIVSQEHHGSGQDTFLTPPRPNASHRLSRPTSGLLPDIEGFEGDMNLTPWTSIVGIDEQSTGNAQEREQANADQEAHEGEQVTISETARTSGEAAQAGQNTEEGENSHAVNTANESESLHESDINTKADALAEVSDKSLKGEESPESKDFHDDASETQADGVVQADEYSHKFETASESEVSHDNGMDAEAGEDTPAGEKSQQGETAHEIDTPTSSGK